jgi:hypothetical protein
MATVIDLNVGLQRLVEALEVEVAECRRVASQTPPSSWQHKVCTVALIEAERRLSIAEGMRRDWRS